ncbi:hypothetical protein EIN_429780 [Entamoeba invadens IP1]|uniref:Uncharacterized protein n=1 Tax=Entamoeba invadens IP1 TaxID=370355 RepID=A0A0A1UHE9_ENTIV|nr:hypothetical protein EIN_429780 [Entamoeba invadens IP1]ELP95202.1 hypothetical protein EIN_429780 [Entamoeba invadens IP1]|eukprot:XP_004261973.1 hypothetical protein EIN_429780 [Entamoeba invadens IP1]
MSSFKLETVFLMNVVLYLPLSDVKTFYTVSHSTQQSCLRMKTNPWGYSDDIHPTASLETIHTFLPNIETLTIPHKVVGVVFQQFRHAKQVSYIDNFTEKETTKQYRHIEALKAKNKFTTTLAETTIYIGPANIIPTDTSRVSKIVCLQDFFFFTKKIEWSAFPVLKTIVIFLVFTNETLKADLMQIKEQCIPDSINVVFKTTFAFKQLLTSTIKNIFNTFLDGGIPVIFNEDENHTTFVYSQQFNTNFAKLENSKKQLEYQRLYLPTKLNISNNGDYNIFNYLKKVKIYNASVVLPPSIEEIHIMKKTVLIENIECLSNLKTICKCDDYNVPTRLVDKIVFDTVTFNDYYPFIYVMFLCYILLKLMVMLFVSHFDISTAILSVKIESMLFMDALLLFVCGVTLFDNRNILVFVSVSIVTIFCLVFTYCGFYVTNTLTTTIYVSSQCILSLFCASLTGNFNSGAYKFSEKLYHYTHFKVLHFIFSRFEGKNGEKMCRQVKIPFMYFVIALSLFSISCMAHTTWYFIILLMCGVVFILVYTYFLLFGDSQL